MLEVQRYLNMPGNSFETLTNDYAIKVRRHPELHCVVLNYDQLESPKGHEIVCDCRGLILHDTTFKVMSLPFRRFFNLGEDVGQEFDWGAFDVFPKLDGTLISLWEPAPGVWEIATRGVADASGPVGDSGLTYKELVLRTLIDMGFTFESFCGRLVSGNSYHFELTAPEDQHVVRYPKRKLTLLNVRHLESLSDLPIQHARQIPFVERVFGLRSREELLDAANAMPAACGEGFVIRDYFGRRLKIKSEAHCFASKHRDRLSASRVSQFEIIIAGKDDDVYPLMPEYVQHSMDSVRDDIHLLLEMARWSWRRTKHIESQKDFALAIKDVPYSALLFQHRKSNNKNIEETFLAMATDRMTAAFNMLESTVKRVRTTSAA